MSIAISGVMFVLLDIEGTTTAIDFVHKTLFPYSAQRMESFVTENAGDPAVRAQLDAVANTVASESGIALASDDAIVAQLLAWVAADRKHTALKALQGMIWREGYESDAYQSHIYPDILPALEQWQAQGLGMGIYSSGSVEAQRLLFAHTTEGDLTPFFAHYFDTQVGAKREPDSYHHIAAHLAEAGVVETAGQILFLSDIVPELDAAREAGMQTAHVLREGTAKQLDARHPEVSTFGDLKP